MSYPRYLDLKIGVKSRLAALRAEARRLSEMPHNIRDGITYSWRDVRRCGYHNVREYCLTLAKGSIEYRGRMVPVHYSHCGPEFHREYWADEIRDAAIRHTGWYADIHQHEIYRGIVVALPHGRFLAGYYMSETGERVYFPTVYDDACIAAWDADGWAEYFANVSQEYSQRWHDARKIEDAIESKKGRLLECLALRNRACFRHLREEARSLIAEIRALREELMTEYADCF